MKGEILIQWEKDNYIINGVSIILGKNWTPILYHLQK